MKTLVNSTSYLIPVQTQPISTGRVSVKDKDSAHYREPWETH